MALIHAENIHKVFGSGTTTAHVLRGISLDIAVGEFVAITGKSGAGKSTLLYQLSALDTPTEGVVEIDGKNLHAFTSQELVLFRLNTLGYIFQDYALVQDLSVLENVLLPLMMRGLNWSEGEDRARETLDRVGLRDKYNLLPSSLSGGEQQRVAIARAVAGDPKIIFADEPTANLDSVAGRSVIELLTQFHIAGQTIVMITHEQEYTAACSRIIRVEDGTIVSDEKKTPVALDTEPSYINPVYAALAHAREKGASTH